MKKRLIILILFCSFQGFGQTIGFWRMNGNANDASGNGYNGGISNITFSQANGKLNQGAGFSGVSNSYISISNNSNLNLEGKSCTIAFWMRAASVTGTKTIIFKGTLNASTSAYYVRINSGGAVVVEFSYANEVNYDFAYTATGLITVGKLYRIVITRNYSTRVTTIYVNGVAKSTSLTAGSSITAANTQTLYLGIQPSVSSYFSGALDHVIFDNSVWSIAKIQNDYFFTNPKFVF